MASIRDELFQTFLFMVLDDVIHAEIEVIIIKYTVAVFRVSWIIADQKQQNVYFS